MQIGGIATLSWTVELPEGRDSEEDAFIVSAIVAHLLGSSEVHLWGKSEAPAKITLELHKDDVELEDLDQDLIDDDEDFYWAHDDEPHFLSGRNDEDEEK
jgi:hypothetical protein